MKKLTVQELIDALSTVDKGKTINVYEDVIRGDGWGRKKERTIISVNETEKYVELWIESRVE